MRILFLTFCSPVPPDSGGPLRIFHLLKQASNHHEITTISYGGPHIKELLQRNKDLKLKEVHVVDDPWGYTHKRLGQLSSVFSRRSYFQAAGTSRKMQNAIDRLLQINEYDIVQTEFSHLASFNLKTNAVKIVDAHNIEHDNFRRMQTNAGSAFRKLYYRLESGKLEREEMEGCSKQDALFVTSDRDKGLFDALVPQIRKYVVPNGVDSSYFAPVGGSPEPWSLVFTGTMAYLPNADGILYFLDEIFPRILRKIPQARITVVGKNPPGELVRRQTENVTVTGYVDDVRPYIQRASVYVVPLRMGSGTRLKIGEALSMRKPIVTTSIGCEGIDVVSGETALIADDPESFAEATVDLLHNEPLRAKLTSAGYELMKTRYDWSVIGCQVDKLYQQLSDSKSGRS